MTKIKLRITVKCHAHIQTLTKTPAKFRIDPGKIVGGVAFTRYPVSKCSKPKNDYVQTAKKKKVTKINVRITVKCHAHIQTLTKTPAKFQKDPAKTVGGVAFTRFCDGQSDRRTGKNNMSPEPGGRKNNMSPDPDSGDINLLLNLITG